MTSNELIDAMTRIGMTNADLAKITGKSIRSIEFYRQGRYPVPQLIALIVVAMLSGEISIDWVVAFTA